MIPMGAYEPRWFMKYAHMNPDEMLQAHCDLGHPYTIPSHYDVFKLTDEAHGQAKIELERAMQNQAIGDKIKLLGIGQFFKVPKLSNKPVDYITTSQ